MPSKKSRLQLYADECFPLSSVTHLRSKGISVIHAYDKKNIHKSDRFHLKQSKMLGRTLITLDRDFIQYSKLSLKETEGVIVVSVGTAASPQIDKVCDKIFKVITPRFVKESLIKVTIDKIIKVKDDNISERKI